MSKLLQKKYIWLLILGLITILFLSPNLFNGFLNWDDSAYVIQNELIRDLSFKGIKEIFTTPEVVSTYAPLVLISWGIDYAIAGLNPVIFHATNLLLHVLVVGSVFYFTKLVSKNKIIALITAVLFGIHPMHVEVVGWVSARKDLLYSLFFMGALIVYYFYNEKNNKYPKSYYYVTCLLLFVLSLLSKGTAVILPLILFLIDYLRERKLSVKLLLEKIPFLILSVFFVILSIKMQDRGGAMEDRQFVSLIDSLSVGFYGYLTYLIKSVIPFNLSAYHPYPNQLGESNPWYYYASAIPVLALFTWLMTCLKKNRMLVFGFGFFFITLIPVIQVLPFGSAVTSDRYTYLPYLGLLLLLGKVVVYLYDNCKKYQKVLPIALAIYVLAIGGLSFQYSKTFKNGETLWTNVIKHYPDDFLAYMNRAEYRISKKQYQDAIEDSDKAIAINPNYASLYYNRAFAYGAISKNNLAIHDLNTAVNKKKDYLVAYLNRGLLYGKINEIDKAINDFTTVIQLAPNEYYGYYNRAVYLGKKRAYHKGISDLNVVIDKKQFLSQAHYLRGKYHQAIGDINNAFKDYSRVITLDPAMASAFEKRGHLWLNKGLFNEALKDYQTAILLDKTLVDVYINIGVVYMNLKEYYKAGYSFEEAKKMQPNNHLIYYNKALLFELKKDYPKALVELNKCLKISTDFLPAINKKKELENLL